MDHKRFSFFRQNLQKTQKEMANLLGISLKAVQSFEQGWRKIPVHIERQLLFLWSTKKGIPGKVQPCWDVRNCPSGNREACPAWEFNMGGLCWFINGTLCEGKSQGSWAKKMKVCQNCEVFVRTMNPQDWGAAGQIQIRRWRKSGRERNG